MDTNVVWAVLGIVLLAWALVLLRRRMAGVEVDEVRPQPVRNPYHCVAIKARGGACAAAQHLKGKRFLAAEAPPIPLQGCSAGSACSCIYIHFDDRREGNRRDVYANAAYIIDDTRVERRASKGRRRSDVMQLHPTV